MDKKLKKVIDMTEREVIRELIKQDTNISSIEVELEKLFSNGGKNEY